MTSVNTSRARLFSIVGCLTVQLCVGIIYLWSIFKTPVAEAFGCGTGPLSMVSSYMLMAFVIGCFVGGILNDRRGARLTCLIGVVVFSSGIAATAKATANISESITGCFCHILRPNTSRLITTTIIASFFPKSSRLF